MKVIGLTGQTGAGKTTASNALRAGGLPVIDCDLLAREVVNNSKSCLGDLVLAFGCDIIDHNGELNRRKLAAAVFGDKKKLRRLNAITFPHIVRRIEEEIAYYRKRGAGALVLDAPTLYEAKADKLCDAVVAVIAPEQQRLQRIIARDGLSEQEAVNRIRSQHDDAFFRRRAGYLVENNGSAQELIEAVAAAMNCALSGIPQPAPQPPADEAPKADELQTQEEQPYETADL
ncbi:MAG: dephospho-CoA kinase [Provencibacterium sp.]|jgi:dephospho-CoA kinase|nr:dephospho-CoA kinase [Provencibacterium sp.]